MTNRNSVLLLLALALLIAGCGGKGVPMGELPCSPADTLILKSSQGTDAIFTYCLTKAADGSYVIQGNAQFDRMGKATDAKMQLILVKDKKLAGRIPLQVRGTEMDKKIYFYKEFQFAEPFDAVTFNWKYRYRF